LISFVSSLGSAICVLLPHEFVFAFRGEALLAESDHRGVRDVTEAYRAAGLWTAPHLRTNGSKIAVLSGWLTASCVLLASEIVLWTLSLTG
jgi:hypothetical protein